ncbi:MAG: hypothetical protein ACRDPW_05425 [Mycobacteriales bacterium]
MTEPALDLDREVTMDDDDVVVAPLDGAHEETAEQARRRESENDTRLLEDRPPHW